MRKIASRGRIARTAGGCGALTLAATATIALTGSPGRRRPGGTRRPARGRCQGVGHIRRLAGRASWKSRTGPEFTTATGYPFEGFGGGSNEDAAAIKGKVRQADVFVSASASADKELEGAANGNWVSWYSTFTSSTLELGYNPKSKFGKQLAAGKPWYKVLTEPGIRVGRTEPKADPKGKLTVEAVDAAAKKLHDPALDEGAEELRRSSKRPRCSRACRPDSSTPASSTWSRRRKRHVPTVPLTPVYKYADYTVTLLNNAQNPAGAEALVSFLLSPKRKAVEKAYGLVPIKPKFSGNASAVPAGLRSIVGAG